MCTEKIEINKYIPEDLVTLFKIKEIHNEIDNTTQIKRNRIEELEKLLNYSYDDFWQRKDKEDAQEPSKNIWENIRWNQEIHLVKEEEKYFVCQHQCSM